MAPLMLLWCLDFVDGLVGRDVETGRNCQESCEPSEQGAPVEQG